MNTKKVFLYNMNDELIKIFKTTEECALFFDKEIQYIYHNLKYCKKIKKDNTWYKIKRENDAEEKIK